MTTQQVTRAELNEAVKELAARDRRRAVAVLARFNVMTTPQLQLDDIQAVYDACTEELAKLDAGAAP
jgi:hypothetical protein